MRKLLLTLLIASSLSFHQTHSINLPDLPIVPYVIVYSVGALCITGSVIKILWGTPTKTSKERNICALGIALVAVAYLAYTTK